MLRKSSTFTERPQMLSPFSKGTVKLIPNIGGIWPLVIIKLNNLLNTVAIAGWLYWRCSAVKVIESDAFTGLTLNAAKCEIIMNEFSLIDSMEVFQEFIRIPKEEMTLLGRPSCKARTWALKTKVDDLDRAVSRLKLLHAHAALVLLKNSLSMPRSLYIFRIFDCHCHPLLVKFDDTLRAGLPSILNMDFGDTQWLQATLPVKKKGIGFRSETILAPSVFLASVASTLALQQAILSPSYRLVADDTNIKVEAASCTRFSSPIPETIMQHIQRAYRELSPQHNHGLSCNRCDHARLKAASAPHSGDWFTRLQLLLWDSN